MELLLRDRPLRGVDVLCPPLFGVFRGRFHLSAMIRRFELVGRQPSIVFEAVLSGEDETFEGDFAGERTRLDMWMSASVKR